MVATKLPHKNAKLRHLVAKDEVMDQSFMRSTKVGFFRHFLFFLLLSNAKRLPIKAFLEVYLFH